MNLYTTLKELCLIPGISGREKKLLDPGIDIKSVSFLGGAAQAVGFTAEGAYIFSTK